MYGRGHTHGTRKQRPPEQPWYAEIEEDACRAAEAAWQEATTTPIPQGESNVADYVYLG